MVWISEIQANQRSEVIAYQDRLLQGYWRTYEISILQYRSIALYHISEIEGFAWCHITRMSIGNLQYAKMKYDMPCEVLR